jgi:hypothetical protein
MSLSAPKQALTVSRTERSTSPDDKDPLEKRSLPRTVSSVDERQSGWEAHLGVLDAAEIGDGDL